jgi:transcriptional regulator with PAS, ATPase and Fis domain
VGDILVSWIGGNDLAAFQKREECPELRGPVLSTLFSRPFSKAYLLYNYHKEQVAPYLKWIAEESTFTAIESKHFKLSSPIHFGDIHQAADGLLNEIIQTHPAHSLNLLLSPGTPAMQAVWILLGKTRYPAVFYQSSIEQGVQQVEIPFDITAEFLPEMVGRHGRQIANLAACAVPVDAAFDDILTKNPQMEQLKIQATVMAQRDVPVLIYGETGTGKELFATAIHNASARRNKPFVPVNCGAIPRDLIDSVLFGHVKGAFTGAAEARIGYFQESDGGTLFLDEFGDLPLDAQVRLLRVVQSGELTPVGSTKSQKIDVRIVAATNRNLIEDVAVGRFREDLFYRIAVGVLHLPALRERKCDLGLLADALLEQINQQASGQPEYVHKKLSLKGKNVIQGHPWRGNIRELHSTLFRASLWSQGDKITESDIEAALFKTPGQGRDVLGRDFDKSFSIQSVIDEVVRHYVARALVKAGGKRTQAAGLLGLSNYQTLSNWIKKYDVPE